MTYKEVATAIGGIGLPYAYNEFTEGTVEAPPFICYYYGGRSADLLGDNRIYQRIRELIIELYTDEKDFSLEEQVEESLLAAGLVFSRQEARIESERMYMITYTTSVDIQEETTNA